MSRLEFQPTPEQRESAPTIDFTCQLGRFALRPWNAALFTFRSELSNGEYNHIYTWETEGDHWPLEEARAMYIPEHYLPGEEYAEAYKTMVVYMLQNGYPAHLNGLNVPKSDERVITAMLLGDLANLESFPEDWGEA